MYLPKHFAMDLESSIDAMNNAGVAHLVTTTPNGITASTLPMLYVPTAGGLGSLHGHVARANRQWIETTTGSEALVLFHQSDIEGKAKFSQNRSVEDIAGVIADLRDGSSSDRGTAHDMTALTERNENR